MAMKKCRECGHSVSSSAKKCPSCGVKEPYISPFKGIIFLVAIGWATWVVFIDGKSSDSGSSSSYHSNDIASSRAPTSAPFVSPDVAKVRQAAPVNMTPASTAPFSASQVCKAAIASLFSPKPGDIKVVTTKQEGVYRLSYKRRLDGERFTYDCKLSDDYIIWTDATQPSTRWSGTGNVGYNVVFSIENGTTLKITELYAEMDNVTHRFSLADLR